jgi:hypothetical protein
MDVVKYRCNQFQDFLNSNLEFHHSHLELQLPQITLPLIHSYALLRSRLHEWALGKLEKDLDGINGPND